MSEPIEDWGRNEVVDDGAPAYLAMAPALAVVAVAALALLVVFTGG